MTENEKQNTTEQTATEQGNEGQAEVVQEEAGPSSGARVEVIGEDSSPRSQRSDAEVSGGASADDVVAQAKAETLRMRDQMLRVAADFDNFRKRSRRELDEAVRRGKDDLLRELLPVFDNLDRAVAHAEQASDAQSVADGVKIVLRQFQDTVGRLGVTRVKGVGEAFDPNIHEAIQQMETAEQAPGTVVAEVQAGYTWDERLVRAAMVVVAKAPAASGSNDSSAN